MKTTLKLILATATFALGVILPATATAQQAGGAAKRVQMMTEELGLSPDQVTAIKQILKDSQTEMKAARDSGDREAMVAARKATNEKIDAVLTPEQMKKQKAMAKKGPGKDGDNGDKKKKKKGGDDDM